MATDAFDGSGPLTSPWIDYIPTSVSNLTQAGGQLANGAAVESEGNSYGGAASGDNQYSEIVIAGSLGSAQTYWSACARISGTGGSRNLYQVTVTSNHYYITKVTAGSSADLVDGAGTFNGSGTPFTLRIEVENSGSDVVIRGYKDGVLIDSATDVAANSPHFGGQPGMECFAATGVLTPINSWEGADLSSGAYSLTCDSGSYALNGQTVGLVYNQLLAAAQGSYSLNGQNVTLTYGNAARVLECDQGSYTLIGSNALVDLAMVLAQGSYGLTGQTVDLNYAPIDAYILGADQGAYALNGQVVDFTSSRILPINQGSYNLSGQPVGLIYSGAAGGGGGGGYGMGMSLGIGIPMRRNR